MDLLRVVATCTALATGALACFGNAIAQGRVWRIGVLETTSRVMNATNLDALRTGLRTFGYVEGKNLVIHYRSADGAPNRFPDLAGELVQEKVDLIVTRGTPATRAAMAATKSIPIVTTAVGSPVRSGLVKSLAHPGGNVTGLSAITSDLSGKRIELIKEILPRVDRIGLLANLSNPNSQNVWQECEKAAKAVGLRARALDVRQSADVAAAFEVAQKDQLGALLISPDTVTQQNAKTIAELAITARLPTVGSGEFAAAGALASYAGNIPDLYRRAATYVDKIFKGAHPGDLPMEEPTTLELTINLKTAKALGIVIPKAVLFRADKVIE